MANRNLQFDDDFTLFFTTNTYSAEVIRIINNVKVFLFRGDSHKGITIPFPHFMFIVKETAETNKHYL